MPPDGPFRILEGEQIDVYLKTMIPKEGGDAPAQPPTAAAAPAGQEGPAPTTGDDGDVQMTED